jgi:uncharacterized protein
VRKRPSSPQVDADRLAPIPVAEQARISNLDALRGIAVLGILLMNGVAFGLPTAAYFNLSADGSASMIDRMIGVAGEIFIDHKMMGLFSVLFGAGIALFMERADARARRPVLLGLWRNLLLLGIGLLHELVWDGDVLVVYALWAPFVIAMRNMRPRMLFALGTLAVLASPPIAVWAQSTIPANGAGLGEFWFVGEAPVSGAVDIFLFVDFFGRAFGMMLIGVGLYRLGVLSARLPRSQYRSMVVWGFGAGLSIAAIGVAIQVFGEFSTSTALLGEIPNSFATIPVVMGYIGLITLWNRRQETPFLLRIRAVGRMALTNYLMQTVFGVIILQVILDEVDMSRRWIVVFVGVVWAVEIMWSKPWLDRFAFGPAEWLWRSVTYLKLQPLRRTAKAMSDAESL